MAPIYNGNQEEQQQASLQLHYDTESDVVQCLNSVKDMIKRSCYAGLEAAEPLIRNCLFFCVAIASDAELRAKTTQTYKKNSMKLSWMFADLLRFGIISKKNITIAHSFFSHNFIERLKREEKPWKYYYHMRLSFVVLTTTK
jgi:hypothetical protein